MITVDGTSANSIVQGLMVFLDLEIPRTHSVGKAGLYGIQVVEVSEAYTSRACHACGEARKSNRKHRGLYVCTCGWHAVHETKSKVALAA